MQPLEKPVSMTATWNKAIDTLKATHRPVLQILAFIGFIPMLICSLILIGYTVPGVGKIRALASSWASTEGSRGFQPLVEVMADYFGVTLVVGTIFLLFTTVAYLAVTQIAITYQQGLGVISSRTAFRSALTVFFPRGILLALCILIVSIEQFVLGPFRVITMIALMAPVLLLLERRGALPALWNALRLRYVRPAPGNRLATVVVFIGLGAMVFFAENMLFLLSRFVLFADEWLGVSRGLWVAQLGGGLPTLMFLVALVLNLLFYSFIFAWLPSFTVSLYFQCRYGFSKLV